MNLSTKQKRTYRLREQMYGYQGCVMGDGMVRELGMCNPLQYSCLENPMDGGAWQAAVHGVAKSRTRLSN